MVWRNGLLRLRATAILTTACRRRARANPKEAAQHAILFRRVRRVAGVSELANDDLTDRGATAIISYARGDPAKPTSIMLGQTSNEVRNIQTFVYHKGSIHIVAFGTVLKYLR